MALKDTQRSCSVTLGYIAGPSGPIRTQERDSAAAATDIYVAHDSNDNVLSFSFFKSNLSCTLYYHNTNEVCANLGCVKNIFFKEIENINRNKNINRSKQHLLNKQDRWRAD